MWGKESATALERGCCRKKQTNQIHIDTRGKLFSCLFRFIASKYTVTIQRCIPNGQWAILENKLLNIHRSYRNGAMLGTPIISLTSHFCGVLQVFLSPDLYGTKKIAF